MKSIVIVFALAVCACGEGATILSSDGSKTLGYCGAGYWTSCVPELCPKGYTVVNKTEWHLGDAIIKCIP